MTYLTYRLDLAYKGTNYFGWQYQPDRPTVQGTVVETLSRIVGEPVKVYGASRTDAGVHALHQVASVRLHSKWQPDTLYRALNANLPDDILILRVKRAHPKFVARYGVNYKIYHYLLLNLVGLKNPFLKELCWQVDGNLDLESMRRAVELLSGEHDFSAFHKPDKSSTKKRKIIKLEASINKCNDFLILSFRAKYFLRYMVRKLVGAIVQVGLKNLFLEDLQFILESRNPSLAKWIAPPQGLYLAQIVYDDEVKTGKWFKGLKLPFLNFNFDLNFRNFKRREE